ncbi:hypothetical protein J1N35_025001 [Gossypium stocksii]|uniref:Uncharacterized protein n=1 Tax=Gossypium stocksii TaxID=47602 RepID=A0A9D3V8B6_9ROSI|nr:hypothetical protein J1N35_025001 [Gossypium stocksii]
MVTEVVSNNEDENRQSANLGIPACGSSPDLSPGGLRKIKHFPKHDTVKLDKLLASWLLSTISDDALVHLTGARSSFKVWNTVGKRFASKSTLTISTLRHLLYSQKKGQLTIKEYLAKIKGLCDTLVATGCALSEQEQVIVILTGLPVEL